MTPQAKVLWWIAGEEKTGSRGLGTVSVVGYAVSLARQRWKAPFLSTPRQPIRVW